MNQKLLLSLTAALGVTAANATIGASVFVQNTGTVIATFQGSDAGYDSELYLDLAGVGPIFANHSTSAGTTYNLGNFTAGTELIFRLHVVSTGDDWYTGEAARNADNIAHADAIDNWNMNGDTWIGFEDIYGGGDFDYNDHQFSFSNTAVPEPGTIAGLALGGIALLRRRKK